MMPPDVLLSGSLRHISIAQARTRIWPGYSPLLRRLKISADFGEVMPNVPQMGRFFSAVGAALQIATEGQASAQAALQEAEANM